MGFGDFIEDISDAYDDVAARLAAMWAAAEYRKKASKYERLVGYLDGKIALIDAKIEDVNQNLSTQHDNFSLNPESAKGLIITTFDSKESGVWKTQYETILANMRRGLVSLRTKRTSAEQLQIYWEQRAEVEEAKVGGGF